MKKLFLLTAAFASMLFASCEKEEMAPAANETTVTYTVEIPDVQVKGADTKAIGDGFNVNELVYEVWKTENGKVSDLLNTNSVRLYQKTAPMVRQGDQQRTTISLNLVQDQEYTILFWAQNAEADAYVTDELTKVTYSKNISSGDYISNREDMAAFYGVDFVSDGDPKAKTVYLKRPFAQLNLGTKNTATDYVVKMNTTEVVVNNVPMAFNVATKTSYTDQFGTFVFKHGAVPGATNQNGANDENDATLIVNDQTYEWAAMNYMFATNGGQTATVKYAIATTLYAKGIDGKLNGETTEAIVTNIVENVPLKENFRTNIVGNLLTSTTEYEVIIDARWEHAEDGGNIVDVWNGTTISEPSYDPATMTYTIDECSELAWLAAAVNGTLEDNAAPQTFKGKKFDLAADLDLAGQKWTPIGYWETFEGTFDGQNHMIQNLNVFASEPDCYLGLFGCTNNATIKNLNVENATVKAKGDDEWAGGHLGVIVGYPDGESVLENITLTGDIKVEGDMTKKGAQRIGAVVGGFTAKSLTMTNIKVDASSNSYVKGNLYVGGVVGSPLCSLTMTNVESNINVYSQSGIVGGIAGWVGSGAKLTSCKSSGNVFRVETLPTDTENQYMRIGGIVGSWSGKVYLNDCESKGTLSAKDNTGAAITNFEFAGLAGRAHSNDGTNQLFIDNNFVVSNVEGLQVALDYAKEGTHTIMFTNDMVGNVTIEQIEGRNFIINGNDKKYDGTISIDGNSRSNGAESVLIMNINFETSAETLDFIEQNSTNGAIRYAHNVTIENCTFKGGENVVAARFRQCYNISFIDSKVLSGHSLAQLYGCTGVAVEGVEVNAVRGISFGTSINNIIKGSTFNVDTYGVRADGTVKTSLTIDNSSIDAKQPVIVRKLSGNYGVEFTGTNTLNTTEAYQVVFTNGDDEAEYTIPSGSFTITGGDDFSVYPGALVADTKTKFIDAVSNTGIYKINLTTDVPCQNTEALSIMKNLIVEGNGNTITAGGASSLTPSIATMGKYNVVLNNVNVEGGFIGAYYGANVTFNSNLKFTDGMSGRNLFYAVGTDANMTVITIENGDFNMANASGNSYLCAQGNAVIYVKGGNFYGKPVGSSNPYVKEVSYNGYTGNVIITGGTFNFDPTAWVAEGYQAVKSGNVWTVSAK